MYIKYVQIKLRLDSSVWATRTPREFLVASRNSRGRDGSEGAARVVSGRIPDGVSKKHNDSGNCIATLEITA